MAWAHVPSEHLPSALVTRASSSVSNLPNRTLEFRSAPSVTLSGKHTPKPASWRGWKTRPWIARLYGTMLPPSMVDRGVAAWISSLPDSPASPGLPQGRSKAPTTPDGSGPPSRKFYAKYNPVTCSWRTSGASRKGDWKLSSGTWPPSGSMRNGICWQRPTWARATRGNGGGASPGNRQWPTPKANEDNKSPEAHLAMKLRMGGGRTQPMSLNVVAKLWATPRAKTGGADPVAPSKGHTGGRDLKRQAASFHQDPTTTTDGPTTLPPVALHPPFVEALMGIPAGWTDCLSPATESYRLWLRQHSAALSTVLEHYDHA